jgi:hypothetical protein
MEESRPLAASSLAWVAEKEEAERRKEMRAGCNKKVRERITNT